MIVVDHFATVPCHLGVGMIGRRYRLEWVTVVSGEAEIEPFDDRLFDGMPAARAALREARAVLAKATGAA